MKKTVFLLLVFVCSIFNSCDANHYAEADKSLVVEGWICSDEYPVVFLSTSMMPDEKEESLDSLKNHIVNIAKVTISDGDTTVILTARLNRQYRIPYYFTTSWMKGQVGKTYTLTVMSEGFHATASTTIPPAPELDSITVLAECEDAYSLKAYVSRKQSTGYYKFLVQKPEESNDLMSPMNSTFSNDNITSGGCAWPINNPRIVWTTSEDNTFKKGEKLVIRYCAVDSVAYHFWSEFEREKFFSNNWFMPVNHNLPTNIIGGIGYWFGYGATSYYGEVDPPIFYRPQ